jgi:hypothetical protein
MPHLLNVKFPGIVARATGESLILEDQWTVRADEKTIKLALACGHRRQAMRVLKGDKNALRRMQRRDN